MPGIPVTIGRGTCHVLFAYEVGLMIDLDRAARVLVQAQRGGLLKDRRNPAGFDFRPLPLRVVQQAPAVEVAGTAVGPEVELTVFDFGAVSVEYRLPLQGPIERLPDLSAELADNQPLLADSRRRVEELAGAIGDAILKPSFSGFVEDYVVFSVEACTPAAPRPETLDAGLAARILRGERGQLSAQEEREACAAMLSYGTTDLAILDWNAALLFDDAPVATLAVLEFANVQLLEYRVLDEQLDQSLTEAYETAVRRRARSIRPSAAARASERLAELQVDGLALFESVNNALKLLGDQYLARVHRAAGSRLRLDEWERSILRKLETLESIHGKLSEEAAQRRSELLEWIIILLIAFEILLVFLPIRH